MFVIVNNALSNCPSTVLFCRCCGCDTQAKPRAGPSDIAEWRDAKMLIRQKSGAAKALLSHRRHLLKAVSRSLSDRTMKRHAFTNTFTVDNDVFGTQTVLFTRQVLSPADCQMIIDSAERVSKQRGYTTRGVGVTTRDQRVGNLPREVQDNIYRALRSCIRQYAESVDMKHLDYDEMFPGKRSFVIRYDGGVEGKTFASRTTIATTCSPSLSSSTCQHLKIMREEGQNCTISLARRQK